MDFLHIVVHHLNALASPLLTYRALSYNSGRSRCPCLTRRTSSARYNPKGCHFPALSSSAFSNKSASDKVACHVWAFVPVSLRRLASR